MRVLKTDYCVGNCSVIFREERVKKNTLRWSNTQTKGGWLLFWIGKMVRSYKAFLELWKSNFKAVWREGVEFDWSFYIQGVTAKKWAENFEVQKVVRKDRFTKCPMCKFFPKCKKKMYQNYWNKVTRSRHLVDLLANVINLGKNN